MNYVIEVEKIKIELICRRIIVKLVLDKEFNVNVKSDHIYKSSNLDNHYVLSDIARINIFVGKNNSGKSRLLRGIYSNYIESSINLLSEDEIIDKLDNESKDTVNKIYRALRKNHNVFTSSFVVDYGNLRENQILDACNSGKLRNDIEREIMLQSIRKPKVLEQSIIEIMLEKEEFSKLGISVFFPTQRSLRNPIDFQNSIFLSKQSKYNDIPFKLLQEAYVKNISHITVDYDNIFKHKVVDEYFKSNKYFTTLSMMNKVNMEEMIYSGRSMGLYDRTKSIITGLDFYDLFKTRLLGNLEDRETIREYEDFLKQNFLHEKCSIIPNERERKIYIKIGDSEEREVSQIGDGLQQIIIITFPLFLRRETPQLVFIEEPELYMHPGMQVQLIEALLDFKAFSKMVFFLTTHSNHFLDSVLRYEDVSLFRVSANNDSVIEIDKVLDEGLDVIEDLGVKNSSVALTQCTIWLEGITDLDYVSKLLELYIEAEGKDAIIRGIDYDFIAYSGSNLANWDFKDDKEILDKFKPLAISNNILVVADRDKGKRKKHDAFKETLGEHYYVLECLEIENIIPVKIFQEYLSRWIKKDDLDEVDLKYSSYRMKKIGNYLDTKINEAGEKVPRSFKSETGSMKTPYKKELSKLFYNSEDLSWKDLPKCAKNLTEYVYKFIIKSMGYEGDKK